MDKILSRALLALAVGLGLILLGFLLDAPLAVLDHIMEV